MTEPLLHLRGITKSFGAVRALRHVDFALLPGEVHALLGENGAGKSTLMHVAYGMIPPDEGVVEVSGHAAVFGSPRDARKHGIGMVHQHFTTIESLTVEENIRLALGPGVRMPAIRLLESVDTATRVHDLGVAHRQRLEIAKALATGGRVLLLDEPTAVLAPSEIDELLGVVRDFARDGGAVAFITHKLPEALAAADRVTVLRLGAVTFTGPVAGQTAESLAGHMLGTSGELARAAAAEPPAVVPHRSGSTEVARFGGVPVFAGDLIGVAAVEGNGQRELLRELAGLSGSTAASETAAFIPEDRTTEGIIPELTVTENVVLGLQQDARWIRGLRLDWGAARARTAEMLSEFSIRAGSPEALAGTLSGGNQQKVVLARALERRPRLLIAENPTRGLDIRATREVHGRLRAAAELGVAVVIYSSDLDEVLSLAPRVLVVHRGVVREAPVGADRRAVGAMMLGLAVSSER
jgi:simple sugar transport system ATP-binding protein